MTEQELKDLNTRLFEMFKKHGKFAVETQTFSEWYRYMESLEKPTDPPIQTC